MNIWMRCSKNWIMWQKRRRAARWTPFILAEEPRLLFLRKIWTGCYYLPEEKVLFSGDTLFAESLGRTDLPTGSMSAIVHSIAEKLLVLPDDIMVYPGHGDATTIGYEKQYNPVAAYVRKRGMQA